MPESKYPKAKSLAKAQLASGHLRSFSELFVYMAKRPFAKEAKTTPERLKRMLDNPALFCLQDITNMAAVLDVDEKIMFNLVHDYYLNFKQRRKKKS